MNVSCSTAVGVVRSKKVTETVTTIAVPLVADISKSLVGGPWRIIFVTLGSHKFEHNGKISNKHYCEWSK